MLTLDGNKVFVIVSLGVVDDIDMVVVVVVILWALNILCKFGINGPDEIVLLPLIFTNSAIRGPGGSSEFFPYSTNWNNLKNN